jgi:hypothetical protein
MEGSCRMTAAVGGRRKKIRRAAGPDDSNCAVTFRRRQGSFSRQRNWAESHLVPPLEEEGYFCRRHQMKETYPGPMVRRFNAIGAGGRDWPGQHAGQLPVPGSAQRLASVGSCRA